MALGAPEADGCCAVTGPNRRPTRSFAEATITSNNRVMQVIESGTQPTSATTIATAGNNYVFRGVDFKGF
jgi:hypothetical protein